MMVEFLAMAVVALVAFMAARHPRVRRIWVLLAAACLAAELNEADIVAAEAAADVQQRARRRRWWQLALLRRAPQKRVSGGDRSYRGRRRFGAASGYGAELAESNVGLSPSEFIEHFRFAREDIPRLCRALRIPDEFRSPNHCVCEGEEALLLYLKRLSYPNRWCDMAFFFSASEGWCSEICKEVEEHLFGFSWHLTHEMDEARIRPMVPLFAEAVRRKGAPMPGIVGFLDGTFRHFCRPSVDGYNGIAQQMQYSGHKHEHGYNYQGVVTPDGIIVEMNGPYEGRTNDKRMVQESQILDRIARWFPGYYLFGDRGYDHGNPALQTPFNGAVITPAQVAYNRTMSNIRLPVEWAFGKVSQLWGFIDYDKNLKLYQQQVAKFYLNAVLLTNCHSCLYGCETSLYFGVPTPDLEDYLYNA